MNTFKKQLSFIPFLGDEEEKPPEEVTLRINVVGPEKCGKTS